MYVQSLQLILRHQLWFLVHEAGLPTELEAVVLDLWTLRILQLEDKFSDSQVFDSQSEFLTSESDSDTEKAEAVVKSRERKIKSTPSLMDCLALCYLGMITLRLPITAGDIYGWVVDGKLAYWKALQNLPQSMSERLPAHYHAHLSPNSLYQKKRFHSTLLSLGAALESQYGLKWPTLNLPLLLFRYIKELALPLELYTSTSRLIKRLGYNLILRGSDRVSAGVRHLPEAQLAACLVVCTKLLFPFDGIKRYPKTVSESAAMEINWDHWYQQLHSARLEQMANPLAFSTEDMMDLQEKDIFSMSNDDMDQYMDWYQETLLDPNAPMKGKHPEFRKALHDWFPIDENHTAPTPRMMSQTLSHGTTVSVVQEVHRKMTERRVISKVKETSDTVRIGQQYPYYKTVEDLPVAAKQFYEEVGRIAGLDLDTLAMAVFFAEKTIDKWRTD